MAKSNWAEVSFDILKQVFDCLPGWSRESSHGQKSKLPPYLLVCKHWVVPGCSAVTHLAVKGTDAQLQALLVRYSALCSLDLGRHGPEGLASLIHFQHIRSLSVIATDSSRLESVHTLTHLEQLEVYYDVLRKETEVPHLPCTDFSRLTSLTVETEWQEPPDTFLYLTQLQTLRHLSLCTAAPNGFYFAALSLLTSLHLDNFDLQNLAALQDLPQHEHLNLLGHPSDADILMLANPTNLTALVVESIDSAEVECHLSSVLVLSSLVDLELLQCQLMIDGAHHGVHIVDNLADAVGARMVVSTPGASFGFALS